MDKERSVYLNQGGLHGRIKVHESSPSEYVHIMESLSGGIMLQFHLFKI